MGLFRRGRATDLGERGVAVVRGITVLTAGDDTPTRQRLRLEVEGPMPETDGVELTGAPRWIRYGQTLPVVRSRRGWEVEWDAAPGPAPTSVARVKPPDAGIDDKTNKAPRARRKGAPCTVEIREVTAGTFLGMGTDRLDLVTTITTDGMEDYALELKRQEVPFYAAHLLRPATVVPGWVRPGRPDKVVIDWPQAAMAVPGIGEPAFEPDDSQRSDLAQGVVDAAVETAGGFAARFVPGGGPDAGRTVVHADDDAVYGVDFDTWVGIEAGLVRDRVAPGDHAGYAEQRGVPVGQWADVAAAWQGRVRSDWELGARYGAAYELALKGR